MEQITEHNPNQFIEAAQSLDANEITHQAGVYSKMQKAAIIIALLGAQNAKQIVDALDERHVQNFIKAMENIRFIPRPVLLATIAEFITDLQAQSSGLHGGEAEAKKLAEELLSTQRAKLLFGDGEQKANQAGETIWTRLAREDTIKLIAFFEQQRPEFTGFVLTKIDSIKAGEILAEIKDELAADIAKFISSNVELDNDVQQAVIDLLELEYFNASKLDDGSKLAEFMADLLGVLPKARREKLLAVIKSSNPETAKKIEKGLLTFEELPIRLPKTAVPIIFRDMDNKELVLALKAGQGLEPKTVEFLLANISQRMAEQFKEDMQELPELSEKQADKAINGLMGFISRLQKQGRIEYIAKDEDEV